MCLRGDGMARRKRYTDKFRATAVVMLDAQGYPKLEGALSKVANHLDVPLSTLRGWWTAEHNPPPAELRNEKKGDLVALLENELRGALEAMPDKRPEASYRDLGTVSAIIVDKLQLLTGQPTETNDTRIRIEYADTDPDAS